MTLVELKEKKDNCFRWHEAVCVFALSRTLLVALLLLSSLIHFSEESAYGGALIHGHSSLDFNIARSRMAQLLRSADAAWYLEIAESGYHGGPYTAEEAKNWVFFPLFPLLIRGLSYLLGNYLAAGVVVNLLMSLTAFVLLLELAVSMGFNKELQSRALWLLAFFPFSYLFLAPMSEPTFLALTIAAFLLLEKNRLLASALCMALACACRPTGALMLPAYALAVYRQGVLFTPRGLLACAISPMGLLAYMAFLYHHTGNFFACVQNQLAWGRGERGLLDLIHSFSLLEPWNFGLLNAGFLLTGLLASLYLAKQRHFDLALALAVPLLFCLSTGTLISLGRMCGGLFPLYLALALWAKTPLRERSLLVLFSGLLTVLTIAYALRFSAAMT